MRKIAHKNIKYIGIIILAFVIFLCVKENKSQFFASLQSNEYKISNNDTAHFNNSIYCVSCHEYHNTLGINLTSEANNANLCMSCHNPVGLANNVSFSEAEMAEPGISGTSHAWNKPAVNNKYGANLPINSNMAAYIVDGKIICSTCHQLHNQLSRPFLRASNVQDSMCKDCHSIRNIGTYATNPNNKGSHPIELTYPSADPRFHTSIQDTNIVLIDDKIECSSCHSMHAASSGNANDGAGDGYLLRMPNDNTLCNSCHTYSSHQGMSCIKCHRSHSSNQTNIYLIRDNVLTPSSGFKEVVFTNKTNSNSFSDGNSEYNGICEVCHTQTDYFRNDGLAPDQNHYDLLIQSKKNCLICHPHNSSFTSIHPPLGPPTDCEECHGHDINYEYQPGLYSLGKGSTHSHSAHTENDSDDLRGPFINCDDCHDITEFPFFKSGIDNNGDNRYDLSETNVCDNCHSPEGSYDGVNDPSIGAKNNWGSGVYSENNLLAGKEKWCAGCHDDNPANSKVDNSGVNAPKVIGNENESYTYGTGWGYYKTGHGLPTSENYPYSGGITSGAGINCDVCHDLSSKHIDHDARTYNDYDDLTYETPSDSAYRLGYRLNLVDGEEPMQIPKKGSIPSYLINNNDFRLCTQCHVENYPDSLAGPYIDPSNLQTNFTYTNYPWFNEVNRHQYHVLLPGSMWMSDWIGFRLHKSTCIICHNVHGSTNLSMIRDGKLVNLEPGFQLWYYNDSIVSVDTTNSNPPVPQDLPLTASTGLVWISSSAGKFCKASCHTSHNDPQIDNTRKVYRTPFQDVTVAPYLEWTGDMDYTNDGVHPDTASNGSNFTFRIKYYDKNNDIPTTSQLLVDIDGNGSIDTINMSGEFIDSNYTDGRTYTVTTPIAIPFTGPGNVYYRFNFISTDSTANGDPATNHPFYVKQ